MRGRMMGPLATVAALTVVLGILMGCTQAAKVETPEEFYRGKTFTFVVSSDPGSGTDLITRAVAPYFGKALDATVKIENTATDEGANQVYTEAKRDGLTAVANSTAALIANDILKAPGVAYESEKYLYLADWGPALLAMQISPKLPYKTLEELRKAKGLKGGGTSAKGSLATGAALMIELLGIDGKVVTGYKGKKEMVLDLGRGAVDFITPSDSSGQRDEKDGFAVTLLIADNERSPVLPDVPSLADLGVKIPKELEAAHRFITAQGYAVALPPDVPKDRVEYLRNIMQKLNDDKGLQSDAAKVTGSWRPFMPGQELQDRMITIKSNAGLADQIDAIVAKYKVTQ